MNIIKAVEYMRDGGKVRLDYWENGESLSIKNGEFEDENGKLFAISPFMFDENWLKVKVGEEQTSEKK